MVRIMPLLVYSYPIIFPKLKCFTLISNKCTILTAPASEEVITLTRGVNSKKGLFREKNKILPGI